MSRMNVICDDEDLCNLHSLYVDQWDWEALFTEQDRTLAYLEDVVRRIYAAILRAEYLAMRVLFADQAVFAKRHPLCA